MRTPPEGDAVDEDYQPDWRVLPRCRGLELPDEDAAHALDSGFFRVKLEDGQVRERNQGATVSHSVGEASFPPPESAARVQGAYLMLHALAASRLPASAYAGRSVQLPPWPWR